MAFKDSLKKIFNPNMKRKNEMLEKEEKENKEKLRLKNYFNKLMKEPLKLKKSKAGFPLCPFCNEEFKDQDEIVRHLRKNKKEFKELSKIENYILFSEGFDGWFEERFRK